MMSPDMMQDAEIEAILAEYTPAVRKVVARLRGVVRAAVPTATEVAYPHWCGVGYRHLQAGYFCGLFPQQDHVRLLFEFGILLPDANRILEGSGKQTRYLTIADPQMIPMADIHTFIAAALALPRSRQEKLAMIAARAGL